MKFIEFIDNLYRFGLEYFRKYYGPYRAIVVSNKDPLHQGRVQISCPRARLNRNNGIWVYPMTHGAGVSQGGDRKGLGKGMFWPPEQGDAVWIFFDNGDPSLPLGYVGGWFGGLPLSEVPAEMNPGSDHIPKKRGFITPGGAKIILDDTAGSEEITIENPNGQRVLLQRSKVKIGNKDGNFEPMFKASTVKRWLQNHDHSHPFGPTGPPVEPFPVDGMSDDVENT